ncbi:hypothetical protein KPH14_012078 [Odynerus spinipes]|uniref:Uncharacterized protein n=1 Tax=Odynerus spinipes TaxID=1348599 RepID=A0AAD9VJ87_9HYME|nr:hypothetical protein KPH14_012078 [Odynerus spinipes]
MVYDINNYHKIKEFLTLKELKFYTFTPKSLKIQSYVLKGLHSSSEPEGILNELKAHENDNLQITKVLRLSTTKSKALNIKLPIFIVQISANNNAKYLRQIKFISYQSIFLTVSASQTSVKEKDKKIEEYHSTSIPLQNRFEILSTVKPCVSHDPISNVKSSVKPTTPENINKTGTHNIWTQNLKGDSALHTHNTNSPSSFNAVSNQHNTGTRIYASKQLPPINIISNNPKDIIHLIKNELSISHFHLKKLNESKLNEDINNYYKIKEHLITKEYKFYTFTPKEHKIQSFVLKGLHSACDPEDILMELKTYESDNLKITKVIRLSTPKSKALNIKLPIFIVQISASSNASCLKQIKYISFQVIKWENLLRKDTVQCIRCQRIEHIASNCHLDYRCVKCSDKHAPGKCKLNLQPDRLTEQLYCVLCNKSGHPASYKGCPRRRELIARYKNKEVELNNKKIRTANVLAKFATSELSYANALKEKSTQFYNSQLIKESAPSGNETTTYHTPLDTDLIKNLTQNILSTVNEQLVKIHKTVTES